jgi:putative ABC transport system permease protein
VVLGFIVGAAVAGQTFYLFVVENLRQFGALKAIGVSNRQILGMVLLQALLVAFVGFSIGIGLSALFFEATADMIHLRGFVLRIDVIAATAAAVAVIIAIASFASLRKVFVLDPAVVFRG